jgi:hypothetical protein
VYVIRSALRITPAHELLPHHLARVIDLQQRRQHQPVHACGFSEQISVDSSSGSIGTARSGK